MAELISRFNSMLYSRSAESTLVSRQVIRTP